MKIVKARELKGTQRDVDCPKGGFKSLRILLEEDGMGFTVTQTYVPSGMGPQRWHYKNHFESCTCISGRGILTDMATGNEFEILPGTTYALDKHDEHLFLALEDTVLLCVFNPPLRGREVHKEDGSY